MSAADLQPAPMCNVYGGHMFYPKVVFGSTSVSAVKFSKDVTFVRNSAGNYTLTLPRAYKDYFGFHAAFLDASGAILFAVIRSSTIDTDGKLVIEVVTETGTATDPVSGSELSVTIGASYDVANVRFAT